MKFSLTEEQIALRDTARAVFGRLEGPGENGSEVAADQWAQIAHEMGFQGIGIPEEHGGGGGDVLDLVALLRETGRALVNAPFLASSAIAASMLLACDDPIVREQWLPAVGDGSLVAVFAGPDVEGSGVLDATTTAGGARVSGSTGPVVHGATSGLLLLLVQIDGALKLAACAPADPGVDMKSTRTVDNSAPTAVFELRDAQVTILQANQSDLHRALAMTRLFAAAEQLGAAEAVVDMAVGYANDREQFGRQIGSFQAVKHRCADMRVAVERADAALMVAADGVRAGTADTGAVLMAVAACNAALRQVTRDNIQVHGAIGFTWEHTAHLYLRRALATAARLGSPESIDRAITEAVFGTDSSAIDPVEPSKRERVSADSGEAGR